MQLLPDRTMGYRLIRAKGPFGSTNVIVTDLDMASRAMRLLVASGQWTVIKK